MSGLDTDWTTPPGDVAQLGERRPCKAEAVGSIPIISISLVGLLPGRLVFF